jgi:hypothetical protein
MPDLSLGKTNGDVRCSLIQPTDVCSSLASPFRHLHPFFWVTAPPPDTVCDRTARVAPICCLGRIVPNTTVELAASEIAPNGPVRPLDTTLDAPQRAPRQLAKGSPTDRCSQVSANPRPPFPVALSLGTGRAPHASSVSRVLSGPVSFHGLVSHSLHPDQPLHSCLSPTLGPGLCNATDRLAFAYAANREEETVLLPLCRAPTSLPLPPTAADPLRAFLARAPRKETLHLKHRAGHGHLIQRQHQLPHHPH